MSLELNSTNFLSATNLKAYYRFESGALTTDSSGEGHTIAVAYSDPAEDASGKFGGAVALDGNDAYGMTDTADFKPTTAFTVGAWVKNNAGVSLHIFQSYSANTNIAGWGLGINASGIPYLLTGKNTGTTDGTDYKSVNAATAVNDNAWHFVVATWDGSNINISVDGGAFASAAWANAPAYAATNYVRIGCRCTAGTNDRFWVGSIDDVFLFNGKALSADEIKAIYLGLNWKSLDGLGLASIKEINGLAIESVKNYNGI